MKILAVGDVVGRPGRQILKELLPELIKSEGIDLTIANGENAAGGVGITRPTADEIFDAGVDVITLGNHVWDKKEVFDFLDKEPRILRPLNYPGNPPGHSSIIAKDRNGSKVAVISLHGRVFFPFHLDCPFRTVVERVRVLRTETQVVIVDFHAEATSEKIAMGWYLEGRVSAVLGTHTHVQTADETILPGGTAYITDLGMTGPIQSVIGIKKDQIIERFLTQLPTKFEVAKGPAQLAGAVIDIEESSGRALSIKRILIKDSD